MAAQPQTSRRMPTFHLGQCTTSPPHIRFALLAPTALRKPPPVTRQVWQFNFLLVLLGSCVASSLFDTIEHILHSGACQLLDLLGTAVPNTSTFFLSHARHRQDGQHHGLSDATGEAAALEPDPTRLTDASHRVCLTATQVHAAGAPLLRAAL